MNIEMDSKMISKKDIKGALEKRKGFILQNLENMTLKALRKDLENELGLEVDELKPYKRDIALFVDQILAGTNLEDQNRSSDSKAVKEKVPVKTSNARKEKQQFTSRFLRLRKICTKATIKLPPSIYRLESKEMEEAVVKYLNVHGLQEGSSHADIIQVKEKIGLERDLDGIDTSNIIEDGPRSRRKATARFDEINDGVSEEDDAFSTESKETSRENESQSDFVSQADHATAEDSY